MKYRNMKPTHDSGQHPAEQIIEAHHKQFLDADRKGCISTYSSKMNPLVQMTPMKNEKGFI